MYTTLLAVHSWVRWLALIAVVGTTLAAVRGKVAGASSLADRWGMVAMMALDIQLLLGLLLYFVVSPNMKAILDNFGGAMRDPALRFWAVEHTVSMFAAIALAHVGRVLARKAASPAVKRSRLLICFGLSMVLIIVGMPWPGRPGGRPLFRGLCFWSCSRNGFRKGRRRSVRCLGWPSRWWPRSSKYHCRISAACSSAPARSPPRPPPSSASV